MISCATASCLYHGSKILKRHEPILRSLLWYSQAAMLKGIYIQKLSFYHQLFLSLVTKCLEIIKKHSRDECGGFLGSWDIAALTYELEALIYTQNRAIELFPQGIEYASDIRGIEMSHC